MVFLNGEWVCLSMLLSFISSGSCSVKFVIYCSHVLLTSLVDCVDET